VIVSATHRLLRFGVFELNLDTEEMRKSGTAVRLPPQSFKLLALLASHAAQVVSRDEIQKELWGEETFVDFEHGVNKCIKQIRSVLGDDADHPLYIETLPRHGYRFLAPVVSKTISAPRPRVVESDSSEQARSPLLATSVTAGTASAARVAVPSYSPPAPEPEVVRLGGPSPRVWRARLPWVGAVVVLAALVGGGLYWRAHSRLALTERDTIVLADFDNTTGDAVFDGALRQGLWADLEQSPFLNILSEQRIAQTMALMTQPKGAALTPALAREVCVRSGSAAALEGAIALLGRDYVVGLKAVSCQTGDEIAVEQFTVNNKEKILPELGKAASRIRRKLGESLASVQKYDVPLESVTTPSLEALQAYTLGRRENKKADEAAAVPLLQQAIRLDPNFAMAYVGLGASYYNLKQPERAAETLLKAYTLRDRVGERERLSISALYEHVVTGNLEAALKTYETWAKIYPRDPVPRGNIGSIYGLFGHYEKKLAAFQEALKLDPGNGIDYANIVDSYVQLNRLDEAKAMAHAAQANGADSAHIHVFLYQASFLEGDTVAMETEVGVLRSMRGWEPTALSVESDTAAYAGRFAKARDMSRRAYDSALRAGDKETAAGYVVAAGVREALVGNTGLAKQQAQVALSLSNARDVQAVSAIVLALAGDSAQATRLADGLARRFQQDSMVQFEYLPMIHASIALGRANRSPGAEKAIEAPSATARYELGDLAQSVVFRGYPIYLRGDAFLALHQGAAAAAEFQKILDNPGVVINEPIGALAHLGLGRAYALSGDTTKARVAYQDFFTLWKDADPNIPILQQAKAEYAKLR